MLKIFKKKEQFDTSLEGLKAQEMRYVPAHMLKDIAVRKEKIIASTKELIEKHLTKMQAIQNRAKGMQYFDSIAHYYTNRVAELQNLKKEGRKVVGTLCIFVPNELIYAAGAIPIRLCSGIFKCTQPADDLFGDAGLCPLVKSTLGAKMLQISPYFEMCDLVIAPATCDGKMKLGEILQDYVPVHLMNVPRIKEGEGALNQWLEENIFLQNRLEMLTGNRITRKKIENAIHIYESARTVWMKLCELRKKTIVSISGQDALMLASLAFIDDITRWTERMEKLVSELAVMSKKSISVVKSSSPRIMLAGSPIIWPNMKIPAIVEDAGGIIVCDELCSSMRIFCEPIVVDEYTRKDMMSAIAERYLYPCTCPCFTPNDERTDIILRRIEEYNVDGLVYHILKGCHLNNLEYARLKMVLARKNIPVLRLESEYDMGDVGQLKIRVEAFLEMILTGSEVGI